MDERFAQALIAAAAQRANLGGSPNSIGTSAGTGAQIGNLQNLAQIKFADQATGNVGAGLGKEAASVASREEASRDANERIRKINQNLEEKIAEETAKLEDPDRYQRVASDDGGWNYFNAKGEPISVKDFAKAKGIQIDKALEGSNNPNDQKFSDEYKTLLEYGRALAGDKDSVDKFRKNDKYKGFLEAYKDKSYGDVVRDFSQAWQDYLPPRQLNNLSRTGAEGKDIRPDSIAPENDKPNMIMDWLRNRQRSVGVNYR